MKDKRAKITAACFLLAFSCLVVCAQSGRRLPKAQPASTPTESPEPTPEPKRDSAEQPKVSITVGINGRDMFANIPNYFFDSVLASCAERLSDAPSVDLAVTGKDMTRADASRIAKSQKEGYVVYLELRTDNMAGAMQNDYSELYVEYVLFAPATAKSVTSGRAYQTLNRRAGPISLPTTAGRNSSVYTEALLKQAARDAADHMLSALHMVLPKGTVPGP